MEFKDLAGLSQPLTKLIEVVSSAIGTAYEPRSIRSAADAKAYEIKTLARAAAEAEADVRQVQIGAIEERIATLARDHPQLAERARLRLLMREIEGQLNVERIAEHATFELPEVVSAEPVSQGWRRKFFQEAENVCESDMQALWGQVLAGEISRPGSFGLRTLEVLRQLSRREAEVFRQICGLAMASGWVAMPGSDINVSLKNFGIDYDAILVLRDAGLLLNGDGVHQSFPMPPNFDRPDKHRTVWVNNGVYIELSGSALAYSRFPALIFTQAGKELQRLIAHSPVDGFLGVLGGWLRQQGVIAKRGMLLSQGASGSILVFEHDL